MTMPPATMSYAPGYLSARVKIGVGLMVTGFVVMLWSVFWSLTLQITNTSPNGSTMLLLMAIGTVLALLGGIAIAA